MRRVCPATRDRPIRRPCWDLIRQRAGTTPAHVLLTDDRGRQLTAAGYRAACERVAAGLARSGVRSDSVVAWQLPTGLEAAVLMGALARLDAVQCPVIPILQRAEVGFIAEQTSCSLLVVPRTWRGHDHAAMAHEIAAKTGARVLVVDLDARVGDSLALPQDDPARRSRRRSTRRSERGIQIASRCAGSMIRLARPRSRRERCTRTGR